jgi:hypothetical protein
VKIQKENAGGAQLPHSVRTNEYYSAANSIRQSKDPVNLKSKLGLVMELAERPVRNDAWIPFAIRTLAQIEARLKHDLLRFDIISAEKAFGDLAIHKRLPESRTACWWHIKNAIQRVRILRRAKKGSRP